MPKISSINTFAIPIVLFASAFLGGCEDTGKTRGHGHENPGQHLSADHEDTAPVIAEVSSKRLADGETLRVTLSLTDRKTGEALGPDDLKIAHTRKVHLLIIDENLEDYRHIHPVAGDAKGTWVFDFTPAHDRPYRIWADIVPIDAEQLYARTNLVTEAGGKRTPAPPIAKKEVTSVTRGGLKFELAFEGPVKAGEAAMGTVTITDAASGEPYRKLEPVMAAFGHIVAFNGSWDTISHVHPMGTIPDGESARGGPALSFHISPQHKGVLKIFVQVQKDGEQIFAPFTITAR